MQTLSEAFLTKPEQDKITKAVQMAEKATSGEIVPMIVSSSHDYPMAAVTCGFSLAIPISVLLTYQLGGMFWIGSQNMWLFFCIFSLLYVLFFQVTMRTNRLKYFFLNKKQVEQEVRDSALTAFFSEQLYKTRDANGILLYVSVLEKKVWVLGDTNINNKIEQKEWDSLVGKLTSGIKTGRQCEALCNAIEQIGATLQSHFPYQKDDTDELHNLIIR